MVSLPSGQRAHELILRVCRHDDEMEWVEMTVHLTYEADRGHITDMHCSVSARCYLSDREQFGPVAHAMQDYLMRRHRVLFNMARLAGVRVFSQ